MLINSNGCNYVDEEVLMDVSKNQEPHLNPDLANLFFVSSVDLLCICTREGILCKLNTTWEVTLGFRTEDLEGRSIFDFLHPDDMESTKQAFLSLAKGNRVRDFINRYRAKDGAYHYLEWCASLAGDYLFCSARDVSERRKKEEELRESEHKFRQVFETSNAGKSITLPSGEIFVNQAFCRMLGYEPAELRSKTWQEITPSHDIDGISKLLSPLRQGLQDQARFNKRYIHKNGSYIWCDVSVAAHRDESGDLLHFFTTVIDISRQVRAEEALRNSEASVKNILHAITDPEHDLGELRLEDILDIEALESLIIDFHKLTGAVCGILDAEGKVLVSVGWQDICKKFHRMNPETLKNCTESDTILASDIPVGSFKGHRCKNNLWDLATPIEVGGKHLGNIFLGQFMYEGEMPDEELFREQASRYGFNEEEYIEALKQVPHWSKEKVETIMAFYQKLAGMISSLSYSKLRLASILEEQKQIEIKYQTLFDKMLDGFALHEIVLNESGEPVDYIFLAVNPAFERMTGLMNRDIVGKAVSYIIPSIEKSWIDTYGKVALTGEPVHFENYAKELDKHFEVTAFRPAPMQFACMFIDITERKRAEKEKALLQEQLSQAQKIESVGRLAGGVAHDFNNMLSIILGHAMFMADEVGEDNPLYDDLNEIIKAGKRSSELTKQLLAFARKQTISPQVLNLNKALENMLKMLERLIGEDINLKWYPGDDLWEVKIDPSQLDQVLTNLCVNARDAISNVGEIKIETSKVTIYEEDSARKSGVLPGDFVCLSVSDNGCGIEKDQLESLFEPFFTTKEVGRGTGLGLSTIYGIVKQNNGFIGVYSEPGVGSTFRIYFPRYLGDSIGIKQTEHSNQIIQGSGTVLLVEDESAIMRITKRMVERMGFEVICASSPREAIEIAKSCKLEIKLLITDVIMPEMNGRDLTKNIKALHPNIKSLFMSGYTANVIAHQSILDNDVHFISKPFTLKELSEKIAEALEEKA